MQMNPEGLGINYLKSLSDFLPQILGSPLWNAGMRRAKSWILSKTRPQMAQGNGPVTERMHVITNITICGVQMVTRSPLTRRIQCTFILMDARQMVGEAGLLFKLSEA